jgi:hypothetical protein
MNECLVAVASGDYTLNFDDLVRAANLRWEGVRFILAGGRRATTAFGRLQIHSSDTGHAELIAALLAGGAAIRLEGAPEKVAEFMAWLTTREGFPDDGSVVVLNWRTDDLPLTPATTAETLLDEGPA